MDLGIQTRDLTDPIIIVNDNEVEEWVNVNQDLDLTKTVTDSEVTEMVIPPREKHCWWHKIEDDHSEEPQIPWSAAA